MKTNRFLLRVAFLLMSSAHLLQALSTPVISRSYGDPFADEVGLIQPAGDIGALDTTFDSDGSLSVDTQLTGGQAKEIRVLDDGTFLVGLSKSASNSVIAKYLSDGTVESTANFGTSGVVDLGTTAEIEAMVIDNQGRILVSGGNDSTGTTGFLKRVSTDGDTVVTFVDGSPWRFIGGVAQQTSGNIIAAGHDGTNAMIARYTPGTLNGEGTLDTTFGSSGYIVFDGTNGLTATYGLYDAVVDASDNVYAFYREGTAAKVAKFDSSGALVSGFGTSGIQVTPGLDSSTPATMRCVLASNDDLIIAGGVSSRMVVRSITSASGSAGSYADFTSNSISAVARVVRSLIAISDGKVFLVGSNTSAKESCVIRLTSAGALDTDFNTTGYNEFTATSPDTSSLLYGAAIAPNGTLFVAGYEINSGVTIPYISHLYNDLYVSEVAQFPTTSQEGNRDATFGTSSTETYSGVTMPFNGLYGASLQQKANTVVELASEKILIGLDGKLDANANSNMMLARLTTAGALDTSFNSDGMVALTKNETDEYLLSIVEDASTNLYISGYSTAGSVLRKYNASGSETWVGDDAVAGNKGVGIGLQGTTRVLLFTELNGGTTGEISGHDLSTGALDNTFGSSGVVGTAAFSLNMGPVYGYAVNPAGNIFIAYKNSSTNAIDVAALNPNGTALIEQFGIAGVITNVFSSTSIVASNVRVALDANDNVVVAASTGTDLAVIQFDGEVGDLDENFNSGAVLTISSVGTTVVLENLTVLSDSSILITSYDNLTDDIMLVAKVTSAGAVDTTFNSQGATQGILPIQVGNKVANYSARVATGLAVQSSTGDLIISAYEQQDSTDATPMVMRVVGTSGTTGLKTSPTVDQIPGTLDLSFDTDGVIDLTSLIAAGAAKVVYTYRTNDTYEGKILVGIDASASSSVIIARVDNTDMTLDTTFGTGGILTISSLSGLNSISLDSNGAILIAGTYSGDGWAKRLTTVGAVDVDFTIPANLAAINSIYQQKSGRYLVAGNDDSGNGTIVAFQDTATGPLSIDDTFNPLATGAVVSRINIGTTGLYNLAINDDDTILAAYSDTTVKIAKIKADGSSLDTTFGSSGTLNTTITPNNATDIRVAKDSNDKVIVASAVGGTSVTICRYTTAGAADTSFNTTGALKVISNLGVTVSLRHLMVTQEASGQNKILVLGDNASGGNGKMFAARLDTDGTLDSVWNSSPSGTDTAGVTTFDVAAATRMYSGSISINGNIYAVATNSGADDPLLIQMFGDNYISESEQAPKAAPAGTLDTTLAQADSLVLSDLTGLTTFANSTPKIMKILSDGTSMMLAQEGTSTYVARVDEILGPVSGFNGGSLLTISNATTVSDVVFDQISSATDTSQSFYVVGTHSSLPWVKHYSSAGVLNSNYTLVPLSDMTSGNAIVQQSSGRTVIAGKDGSTGVLAGHSIDGSIDEFGVDGKYTVANSTEIYALTIDSLDRLIVAFKNGTNVNVSRIYANGGGADSTFTPADGDRISGVAADDQVKVMLDENGDIVVGAATATGYKVRRYSATDGSLDSTFNGSTGEVDFEFSTSTGTPKITNMICESSGKMVVLGYNASGGDNRSIIARLTATGALDTTFDTDGTVAGVYEFATGGQTLQYYGLGLYPDRRLMVFGTDTVSGDMLLGRVFGDENDYVSQVADHTLYTEINGQFDTEFNTTGSLNLSTLSGIGNDQAKIVRTTTGARTLVAVDTGSVTNLVALGGQAALDTSFNGSGVATVSSPTGVTDMFVDDNEKILVVGTTGGANWLHRYNADGSNDTTFGTAGLVTSTITAGYTVRQQSNGRILVGGLDSSNGSLIAYTKAGALDLSFGTGDGVAGTGLLAIGSNAIYSFVLDSLDRIIVAYYNGTDVTISRYTSNGSGIDTTFGTAGSVTNALGATITGASQVRVAFDASGNLIVVGATTSTLELARYSAAGALDTGFGTSGFTTLSQTGVTLTDFLISQDALQSEGQGSATEGNLVILGYQNLADDLMFITWLTIDGALDTNFNPTTVVAGGPGYAAYEVDGANSIRQLNSGAMLENGKLLLAGYENTGSIDVPLLMKFYGEPYADQQDQVPVKAIPGTFDDTLNLTGQHTFKFGTGSVQQYAQTVWDLGTGFSLVGGYGTTSTDATYNHFLVTKFDTGGNLDTTFGVSGVLEVPLLTATTNEYLYDMVVDKDDNIIVTGYQDSTAKVGLIRRYTSAGIIDTTFGDIDPVLETPTGTVSTLATHLFAVGTQSTGRIIAIGKDDFALNKGLVIAYTSEGVLDPTFGLNGQWLIDDAAALYSFAIDVDDTITLSYKNSTDATASVARIPANGNQYDLAFGTNGKIADVFGGAISGTDKIKVAIDNSNKVIVVASMNGANTVQVRRYDSSGVVDTTFNTTGAALTITSGNSADRTVVTRLLANAAGQYALIGYEDIDATTTDKMWIAQVSNAGILDTSFNPASSSQAGENLFAMNGSGTLQKLLGGMISSEGKIVAVGQETVSTYSNPVMAVLFDSQYSAESQHVPSDLEDGTFDPSFDTDGIVTVYVNGETLPTSDQQARAIRVLTNGQSMGAISDGVDSWTMRFDVDGSVDSTYGATGVIVGKSTGNEIVTRMEIDGTGRMLIIGTSSVSGGYIKRLSADGSLDTTFNSAGGTPGTLYGVMTDPYSVVEFKTGQIMVAGADSGVGTVNMYTTVGVVDTTFSGDGIYTNGASITSVAVNGDDTIFMAVGYDVTGTKTVRLVSMSVAGDLISTFGTAGVIDSVISDIDAYANIRLALNSETGVTVGSSWNGASGKIALRRYDDLGNVSSGFNSGSQLDLTFSTSVVLTDIVSLENDKVMVGGYQSGTNPSNYSVVERVTAVGALDTTFNNTGKNIFQIDSSAQDSRILNNISVQLDGRIMASISESSTSGESVPSLVRIYGDPYQRAVSQFPGYGTPGTADVSFGRLQDGIAKVYFANDIDLSQYGKGVAITSNSKILLIGNGYTDIGRTYQHFMLARLNDNGILDTSIGGAFNGAVPGTVITADIGANSEIVSRTFEDQSGRVIEAGYIDSTTNQALVRRYSPNGVLDSSFGSSRIGVTHTSIEEFNVIGIQSLGGRIILGGTYDGDGVLCAYKTNGTIDTGFATSGVYTFADSSDITALVICGSDAIYVARKVGADLKITALDPNGAGLLTVFGGTGEITALSNVNGDDKTWIAVDASGKIVVGATIIDGANSRVKVARFSPAGVADSGFNGGSPFTLFTGSQSDKTNVLAKIIPTTDNKILVVGYQDITATTSDDMFAARILSDGTALDTTFNPNGSTPGLYTLRVYQSGENSQFTDAQIQSDGKIVVVGNEAPSFGGNTPVVVRLYGDSPAVSQIPVYSNPRPPIQVGGNGGGGGVGNSLGNSVSSSTAGVAGHSFSGSWGKESILSIAVSKLLKRNGTQHSLGSGAWKHTANNRMNRR